MNKQYIDIKYNNVSITIRKSYHAMQRMRERNISDNIVSSAVIAIADELGEFVNDELMVIDENNNTSILFEVKAHMRENGYFIRVITVIDKSNIFVKSHTSVKRL